MLEIEHGDGCTAKLMYLIPVYFKITVYLITAYFKNG